MLEKEIETALVRRVKDMGGIALKFTSPNRRSVPDRLCLFPGGRVVFVECKRPGGKVTLLQAREHERLRALGFEVVVVDGPDGVNAI